MKAKVTQKSVKVTHRAVSAVGYCGLWNLLCYETPVAYTAGVYGWNADVYTFGDVAITTGYRPFGKQIPFDVYYKYDVRAKEIRADSRWDADKAKPQLDALIQEFIREAMSV